MSRSSALLLTLLALFCFQSEASSLFDAFSSRNTIINAMAASSGVIDLKKDYSSGFYVEADLYAYPSDSTSVPGTVNMMLSIVNDETMVATNCMSFKSYDCSKSEYICSYSGPTKTVVFPSFTAQTKIAKSTPIYLDYHYWSLSAPLYIAQSCQSNGDTTSIGSGKYGVLGMGTTGSSKSDFSSSKVFSFNIESDLSKGTLLFKSDTNTYAQSASAACTLYVNSTWQYGFYSGSFKISSYSTSISSGSVMFDINSDAIGLPYNTFKSLVEDFYYTYGISSCTTENYRPTCRTSMKIEELPDITISVDSHDIKIPSKIYATVISQGSQTSFYFNFKAISPSLSGKSYITPAFQNSIILDARFMSYYYVVFDASSNHNYIYIYNRKITNTLPDPVWPAVGVVAVVFLLCLCICCCLAQKKQNVVTATTTVNKITPDVFDSAQASVVYNQQDSASNYYYNYPGSNNTQQPQGTYPGYNAGYQQPQGGVYNNGYYQSAGTYL